MELRQSCDDRWTLHFDLCTVSSYAHCLVEWYQYEYQAEESHPGKLSPCLLSARFLHQSGHLSAIVCHAPTEISDDAAKYQFYDDLSVVVNHSSRHDVRIVMAYPPIDLG